MSAKARELCEYQISPQSNISVESEGNGIHKFSRIGDQGKDCDPQEFLIYTRILKDNINNLNQ